MRTLVAIAIAPLAVVPILAVIFGPWAIANGGLRSLLGIIGPAAVAAYPLVILIGLPMHCALVHARRTSLRDYVLTGLLLGTIPVIGYVIVAVAFEAKFALSGIPRAAVRNIEWGAIGVVVFGLCTVGVALTFRAIAVKPGP